MNSGKRTTNRQLRERVYAGQSGIHGQGVFAVDRIAAGEYIGTFHGPVAKRNGSHVLWVYADNGIDVVGRRGMNLLRYLNHDRRCNAEFRGFDLYARRPIRANQEITIDYGW